MIDETVRKAVLDSVLSNVKVEHSSWKHRMDSGVLTCSSSNWVGCWIEFSVSGSDLLVAACGDGRALKREPYSISLTHGDFQLLVRERVARCVDLMLSRTALVFHMNARLAD